MYLAANSSNSVTILYIPIRPGRRDPEADEIEDAED